ncbi:hypothetical protein EIP91_004945 [Steccherinum ochraceum]|uniref:NAD(P)-binding protein n=1 Tax=Steccherinum ochraceum TaxID=92696 RepID=A0A4R0RN76_9APHY|nr:hypothetical protein EIP91_004945 [Steccherinum ochraceum]
MPSYVVTGANRGIGFEFVRQLSSQSENTVFAVVRNPSASKDLYDLQKSRENIHVVEADLTNPTSWKTAADAVAKVTGGTLDTLINNAAYMTPPVPAIDSYGEGQESKLASDFVDSFQINVVETIHATNAFLPLILAASKKSTSPTPKVVTLSSGVADIKFFSKTGLAFIGPYTVAKAAQAAVTAQYASTHYQDNVIFFTISPGFVNTAVGTPNEDDLAAFTKIVTSFKRAVPEWNGIPITPEQSVTSMLAVIGNLTKEQNGSFLSHKGNEEWL